MLEKQPQLFAALADDLRLVCTSLIPHYTQQSKDLQSEPGDIDALKKYLEAQELEHLAKVLIQIGKDFEENIRQEVKQVAENKCDEFESNFKQLQNQVSSHVQKFIAELQLKEVYNQAASDDPLYSVTPRIDVFSESFHRVRRLEKVLVEQAEFVIERFFSSLKNRVHTQPYYNQLRDKAGTDACIEIDQALEHLKTQVWHAIENGIGVECDRCLWESPDF